MQLVLNTDMFSQDVGTGYPLRTQRPDEAERCWHGIFHLSSPLPVTFSLPHVSLVSIHHSSHPLCSDRLKALVTDHCVFLCECIWLACRTQVLNSAGLYSRAFHQHTKDKDVSKVRSADCCWSWGPLSHIKLWVVLERKKPTVFTFKKVFKKIYFSSFLMPKVNICFFSTVKVNS